jgi:hypothetical protein
LVETKKEIQRKEERFFEKVKKSIGSLPGVYPDNVVKVILSDINSLLSKREAYFLSKLRVEGKHVMAGKHVLGKNEAREEVSRTRRNITGQQKLRQGNIEARKLLL